MQFLHHWPHRWTMICLDGWLICSMLTAGDESMSMAVKLGVYLPFHAISCHFDRRNLQKSSKMTNQQRPFSRDTKLRDSKFKVKMIHHKLPRDTPYLTKTHQF